MMTLGRRKDTDVEDVKKCVNEIILYLLLNNIRTKIGFNNDDLENSKAVKEKNFSNVNDYIESISHDITIIIYRTYKNKIRDFFIPDDYEVQDIDETEAEINHMVFLELKLIFGGYIPFLSLLKLEKETKIIEIISNHITW